MRLLALCVSLIIFCFPSLIYAQPIKPAADFAPIDSLAKTIAYKDDMYKLTKELTASYTEPIARVRAIFIWITHNIAYDYQFVNKGKELKGPECPSVQNCEQVYIEWELNYLKKILKKKKAICDGYTRLFKKMCELSNIKSEIIGGYVKTKPHQIGISLSANHAWNAVMIDSAWHLLDPTWAAGGCQEDEETGKLLEFHKNYRDYYWFTSFNDLSRNHYPKDGRWVFEPNYTREKFQANPWYAGEILDKIKLDSPASGIINTKKGDTIHFNFTYNGRVKFIQTNTNVFRNPSVIEWKQLSKRRKVRVIDELALKRQQYIAYTQNGNSYSFDYVVTDNSLYYIDVLFDYNRVMRFKVKTPE